MLQGDKGQILDSYDQNVEKVKDLSCIDITGSLSLKGFHLGLTFQVDVIDAKHIFAQTDLKSLGESLKINRLDEIDFAKKTANQWLEQDF